MIYRLRVLLDANDDCFRDIEIDEKSTLEEFHNVIVQAFQLQGDEMASFYASDEEWNQGEEYCLFDMSGGMAPVKKMADTLLEKALSKKKTRMIYIYDFLSLWTFSVELADAVPHHPGTTYPRVIFSVGELPDSAPDKEFEADPRFHDDDDDEAYSDDEDEEFYDEESFDENDLY
ncbi:hypothetical protein [Nonlabens sp.]|uniref:IS1096 element passenger TnpR family protein n=1 Tax=Nonlabens sp. TaxID=1888209 RepID=UPI001BCF97C7|nr:hypothetical protein [Nonlabens sp.]